MSRAFIDRWNAMNSLTAGDLITFSFMSHDEIGLFLGMIPNSSDAVVLIGGNIEKVHYSYAKSLKTLSSAA